MKYPLSTYLAPLLAFGPVFMIGSRQPHPGEAFAVTLLLGTLPYIGAVMLSVGATSLLRVLQKQQKELVELRMKLAAVDPH